MSATEETTQAEAIATHVHKYAQGVANISSDSFDDGRMGVLETIKLYKSLGKNATKGAGDLKDKELRKLLKIAEVPKELLGKKGKISKLPKPLISAWRTIIMEAGQRQGWTWLRLWGDVWLTLGRLWGNF